MAYIYQQRIGAAWTPAVSGRTKPVINPATEEPLRELPFGDGDDCKLAIEAAAAAFPAWSKKTAYERAAVLMRAVAIIRERLADLAHTTTLESGKPLVQSRGEWGAGADLFEWYAEECKRAYGRVIPSRNAARQLIVLRQPLGVVGVITAWNFPIYNIARAGAAALAAYGTPGLGHRAAGRGDRARRPRAPGAGPGRPAGERRAAHRPRRHDQALGPAGR